MQRCKTRKDLKKDLMDPKEALGDSQILLAFPNKAFYQQFKFHNAQLKELAKTRAKGKLFVVLEEV